MTLTEQIITIGAIVLATVVSRSIAFIVFNKASSTPQYIHYLGKVLPPATMCLLVVYTLRNVSFVDGNHGVPEIIAVLVTALLHLWKGNMFLSLGIGTILYMVFVQLIFV